MNKLYISFACLLLLLQVAELKAQFGGNVEIMPDSSHNEQNVSMDVAFNGWVYAAFNFDSALVVRMSKTNGDTWQTIDSESAPAFSYPFVKLAVAGLGNDTSSLRLFELADAFIDTGINSFNQVFINKFNAGTGELLSTLVLDTPNFGGATLRGLDLATDYRFPSSVSRPYSVAAVYAKPDINDSIIVLISTDSGGTYNTRNQVAATSLWYRHVSIAYGQSESYPNGRFYLAWEQFAQFTYVYGNLYEAHTTGSITGAFTTPFNLDSISTGTASQLRGPKISCSMSSFLNNDSNDITALIVAERHNPLSTSENILGFKNLRASNGKTWAPFDIVNTADLTQRPDLSYDTAYNNFLLTYFDSSTLQLPYLVNNFNLVHDDNWDIISPNYAADTSILVNPLPVVRYNPACAVSFAWISDINNNGVAMYDAALRNPEPALTSLSPDTVMAGNPGFTITINGLNFVSGSWVVFGSDSLAATFVSAQQLTVSVPAARLDSVGIIMVTVTSPSGCGGGSISDSLPLYLILPSRITPLSAIAGIKVYPNPVSNQLNVSWSFPGNANPELSLQDITGRVLKRFSGAGFSGSGRLEIDVSDMAAGVYQLLLQSDNDRAIQKITIVR